MTQALGGPVFVRARPREGEEAGFLEEIVATANVGRAQRATKNVAGGNEAHAINEVVVAAGEGTALAAATGASIATTTAGHQEQKRIRVLVVPRHPQRFAEVQALA